MRNPIVTFLTTRNGYTFNEGVAVLAMYANRVTIDRVTRSRDMRMLVHELKQLAHIPGLKPLPGVKHLTSHELQAQPAKQLSDKDKPVVPPKQESDEAKPTLWSDLAHYRYTRYDQMPTPETQQLWLRNNNRWHTKLALFEKMKMLPEGQDLATIRNELVSLSREHLECWALIDHLCEEFYTQKGKAKSDATSFNVSTYRAYIAKALKRPSLTDSQLVELQHRVNALIAAHAELKPETIERLRLAGITVE